MVHPEQSTKKKVPSSSSETIAFCHLPLWATCLPQVGECPTCVNTNTPFLVHVHFFWGAKYPLFFWNVCRNHPKSEKCVLQSIAVKRDNRPSTNLPTYLPACNARWEYQWSLVSTFSHACYSAGSFLQFVTCTCISLVGRAPPR